MAKKESKTELTTEPAADEVLTTEPAPAAEVVTEPAPANATKATLPEFANRLRDLGNLANAIDADEIKGAPRGVRAAVGYVKHAALEVVDGR